MNDLLLWLYLINAVLLINHRIDSAYWEEWKLIELPGGSTGFLLMHFPLFFIVLLGLIVITLHVYLGYFFSLFLCFAGIFTWKAHNRFLKKGSGEFNSGISIFILKSILVISIVQSALTIFLMIW